MAVSKNKEKVGGMVINWITIFSQIVISLFFVPFFLKIVGDKQYGLYSFSTSIIAWIDTLMVAIASAYFKFLTREKKINGEYGEARACGVFWIIFVAISILVLILGIGFDSLLFFDVIKLHEYTVAEKNQICLIILMSIISTTISCFLSVRKSYHYYKQKYILVYSFSLVQIVLQTALSIIALKLGFGVTAVAAIHFGLAVIFTIILSILSKLFLKEKVSIKPISETDKFYRKTLFKEIVVFSGFIIINTVVDMMNRTLDKTILGFYNASSVATYQLAYTLPSYLISFTSIISIVFDPHITDAFYNKGGMQKVNEIFVKVSKLQIIVTFLIIGGFITCGKEFVFLWLDDSRIQVYHIAVILMLTYSLTCCNRLAIIARRIQNYHIKASFIYLGIALFNVALSLLLINITSREFAIWACVIGTVTTYLIGHWIIMQIYDAKVAKINIKLFMKEFIKYTMIMLTVAIVTNRFVDITFSIPNNLYIFLIKGFLYLIIYFAAFCFIDLAFIKECLLFIKNKNSRQNEGK